MAQSGLEGKVVLITGAAQGIGAALAKRFNAEGCRVMISDISEEKLRHTAGEIEGAAYAAADVTSLEECMQMAEQTEKQLGGIDILIANAGILIAGDIENLTPDQFRKVLDINVIGYFNAVKAAFPYLRKRQGSNIIQINSKAGKNGSNKNGAYSASKFAGLGLTQSLALEFAPYGIRVNAICPGNLLEGSLWKEQLYEKYGKARNMTHEQLYQRNIELVPLKRPTYYEDVANVAVFLASEQSSFMTGQALNVTGGQEMR